MPSKIGEYTIGSTLGSGITSVVKQAKDPQGNVWAIKIFEKNNPRVNESLIKALRAEVEVLNNLRHGNIVWMKEFQENGLWEKESGNRDIAYIVLEHIEGGELFDYIANGGALDEKICRFYMAQMLSGIHYLHTQGVTHRDLKPENVLVDANFNAKVADFGFAAPLHGRTGTGELLTKLGTESYMAPEIHAKAAYQGQTVDLFALGIILFIMITGHPPFTQATPGDRFYKFISGNRADVFWRSHARNKKGGFSQEFISLLTSMFQVIPSQRLTTADIVGHPWMQGPMATPEEVRAEFKERDDKIKAQKKAERDEKDQARALKMQNKGSGAHRAVTRAGVVLMGEGDSENKDNSSSETRKLGTYNRNVHKNNEFFSKYPADMIFNNIQECFFSDMDLNKENVKLDSKKWKMCVSFKQAAGPELEVEQEEAEEENKQEEEDIQLETEMEIKLKQVAGTEKLAVQFSHTGGSKQFFYDQYNTIKHHIDYLDDTLLDEE